MKLFQIMQRNALGIAGAAQVAFTENESAHAYILECVGRFYRHDYGAIPPEDVAANENELKQSAGRIIAKYEAGPGLKEPIFIIAYFSEDHPGNVDYNYTTVCYTSDY